ncbi:MAG: hypothetical protein ACK5LX_13945 [Oscillospiraceae bacterium]
MPKKKVVPRDPSLDSEICEFVRSRKHKHQAIGIASILYCRSKEYVRQVLREYGYMDQRGRFLEPRRMTGLKEACEFNMGEKYAFKWTANRQSKLEELLRTGRDIAGIAEEMDTDEATIYAAIDRFNFHQFLKGELKIIANDLSPKSLQKLLDYNLKTVEQLGAGSTVSAGVLLGKQEALILRLMEQI